MTDHPAQEPQPDSPVSTVVDARANDRPVPDSSVIHEPLRRLRARARLLLVVQRSAAIGALLLGALGGFAFADFLLRFPLALRSIVLLLAVGVLGWLVWTRVRPAIRFAPRLTDLALRVEQRYPSMRGRLASALEFAEWGQSSEASKAAEMVGETGRGLARVVVEQTAAEMGSIRPSELIKPAGAKRSLGSLGLILAILAVVFVISPAMFATGAARTLAPWSGAEWPKRTGVVDLTEAEVHPIGRALPMRAALTKSPRAADRTDVFVQYRLTTDGKTGPVRRELLTYQNRRVDADAVAVGDLFERLLEPVADRIEYRFVTDDDATDWRRVRLVPSPAVVGTTVVITPPAYAMNISAGETEIARPRTVELGPGSDDRAAAPGALIGSRVELTMQFNKPASIVGNLAQLFVSTDDLSVEPSLDRPSQSYTARFTLRESVRLQLDLIDEDQIAADETSVYRFDALVDRPAAATIVNPVNDRTVLPSAVIPVRAEGRDDVGLSRVGIEQTRYAPAGQPGSTPSGPGGALEPVDEPLLAADRQASGERLLTAEYTLDLSTIPGLSPGDEVRLVALATDVLVASLPAGVPTRSPERVLRIISEEQLVAEIRDSLSAVRDAAIRTDQQQARVTDRTQQEGASRAARREQAAVSQRLAQTQRDLNELRERVRQNRLDDQTLEDLLQRVGEALTGAGNASTQASATLDEAGARADRMPEPEDPENPNAAPLREDEQRRTQQNQERVRDELSRVVGLLDRGEDDWVIRNTIDRLINQQRELQNETQQAGRETTGLDLDQLTPDQREQLQNIADRQQQLAEQVRDLVSDMRERAQELAQTDPASAEGLQQAADSAEQNQVQQNMQQAAGQAQENRTEQAQQSQQEAIDALEEVRENLDAGERARNEVLRRVLASVIESLEALISDQEREIANLDQVAAQDPVVAQSVLDLAPAMIRVNTNTAAVADLVRNAGPELAPVLNLVTRAVDAQVDAIVEIRSGRSDIQAIRNAETRSLEQLRQALERARALDQQLEREEQQRKIRELRQAYLEALRLTVELRQTTEPYAQAAELTRRDRAEIRRLAQQQGEITVKLESILETVSELRDASVFLLAHRRAESQSAASRERLSEEQPGAAVVQQRALAQTITRILEALEDPRPDEEPFDDGAAGGGGQGGQGGEGDQPLIEILQELRLLRMIQIELAEATVLAENLPPAEGRREIARLAQEQRELTQVAVDLLRRADPNLNVDELFADPARTEPQGQQP